MNKWIKTKDMLPDTSRCVLAWVKAFNNEYDEGAFSVAYCDTETAEWKEWLTDESIDYLGYEVIAWKELDGDYREE